MRPLRSLFLGLLGLLASTVPVLGADVPVDLDQVARQRAAAEVEWQRQEQLCRSRFVVQSCLDDIAAQRRQLEQTLQRQESAAHATERQQRAQEQLERSAEKQRARDERATTAQSSESSEQARVQAQQDKVLAHQRVASSAPTSAAKAPSGRPDAVAQARQRESYLAKQRAAQERRLARDKRLREATGTPQPLPLAR